MNKAVLLSVKPEWVAKILNGEKTIEVRKLFPKDYVGWVYIYCCKNDNLCRISKIPQDRYICGKDFDTRDFPHLSSGYDGKGKVVARFWCDKVREIYNYETISRELTIGEITFRSYDRKIYNEKELCKKSCLSSEELYDYLNDQNGYAIHISKLEIFDKPKELCEFKRCIGKIGCYDIFSKEEWDKPIYDALTKAPQSYMYIESGD